MDTKQVIVMRKDLRMRRGKECAQASHASMAFLTRSLFRIDNHVNHDPSYHGLYLCEEAIAWLGSSFKKVCLQVDSEEELMKVKAAAEAAGLLVHLVVDSGLTEFAGKPTPTCLAIGPHESNRIDVVTGNLKLY